MRRFFSCILLLFFSVPYFSQTILNETAPYLLKDINSNIFYRESERRIIDLRSDWKVYGESSAENKVEASVPCLFKNSRSIIFEKEIILSDSIISDFDLELNCLGINYHAEIMLNEVVIFKKEVANIPFKLELPNNLLSSQTPNILKIIVGHVLDDKTTLPSLQRFLFPQNNGGISRDIFIELLPKLSVRKLNISSVFTDNFSTVDLHVDGLIKYTPQSDDSSRNEYKAMIEIKDPNNQVSSFKELRVDFTESEFIFNTNFKIENAGLWTPDKPQFYTCDIKLFRNNIIADHYFQRTALYKLSTDQNLIQLNGKEFPIKGVSYVTPDYTHFNKMPYKKIGQDLSLIKAAGFNTVRFIKSVPHPYAIEYCASIGLIAFVELPLSSVPEQILGEENYRFRVSEIADLYIDGYSKYSAIAAFGLGSSYLPNSSSTSDFISALSKKIKSKNPWLTYASFIGTEGDSNTDLDLVGLEIYSKLPLSFNETPGVGKLFISEAVYPNYNEGQSGYLHQYSYEAQAKFIEDLINLSNQNKINAYFISTMYDYQGDFTSLYTGFSENNNYSFGILDDENNLNRISYNTIKSIQKSGERITIPMGKFQDDAPLFIVFTGLILAVFMGLLINSKKKFRSDAIRALLRPYNFFADIRDHRIISGFHTILLMIILAGSHALLFVNLLYFLKNSILFEKILLAFGMQSWIYIFSYLAWNPVTAFIYTFILSVILFLLLALTIKGASFFIKTKVLFTNIYYVVIWAFLPMTILLPVKLVLYRVLITESFNLYIYIFLLIYLVWITGRLLKGIYVIFDVSKGSVYFYSTLLILLIFGGILFYFQFSNSTIYYIVNAYKQYQFM